ncbi:hypothetical protein EBH_0066070 [Eimeria brunetti]|uniref:Uncharacterized protein n=1 Tax=Eimeria brunetti TaxID=51314 RepID=U6LF94_9EIME|nr:hypothetical protein EBH_0066070 [Eimeria brunetti]
MSRNLAASLGEEECGESEDSGSTASPAGTSSEVQAAIPTPAASSVDAQLAQRGKADLTFSTDRATGISDRTTSGTAAQQLGTQRGQTGLKRKLEEEYKVEKEAKHLRDAEPREETQLQPGSPPLDPETDSLIDSVLSGGGSVFSESFWLLDEDPLFPSTGSSFGAEPQAVGSDWGWLNADDAAEETFNALPPKPPILPTHPRKSKKERGSERPSSDVSADRQTQSGLPGNTASLHSGLFPGAAEAIEESLQRLAAETRAAPKERKATSCEIPTASTSPSSSRVPPLMPQLSSGVMVFLDRTPAKPSTSPAEPSTDEDANAHLRWLENVYPGVPDSVLATHPFYRYPEHQRGFSSRSFDVRLAAAFAKKLHPNTELAICREIMKKRSLTLQDFDELLSQAEILCGYASSSMRVHYKRAQAMCARETLGTVFLVLDTLHCAAEVLGERSKKQLWWPLIVRHIEDAKYFPAKELLLTCKTIRNTDVALTLSTALEYYRRGCRPPARMVIGLKEALFCERGTSSKFHAEYWNPYRDDVEQWRRFIELSLAGRQ